jgi:hemoglobin-like flavoprotein
MRGSQVLKSSVHHFAFHHAELRRIALVVSRIDRHHTSLDSLQTG